MRHILAARAWTQAFEAGAPAAGWPAYARWTARTPFTGEGVLVTITELARDPVRAATSAAATRVWQQLWSRTEAARQRARQSAGPPGLRAHAAAACALVAAQQVTFTENELIGAISERPRRRGRPVPAPAWGAASRAWTGAFSLDADLAAARTALTEAIEQIYGTAPVRDIALLPSPAITAGEGFSSPAAWAQAEYRALRQAVALGWCQRLDAALAQVEPEAADVPGKWRLPLITGWPLVAERDRELAYLACYPEMGRVQTTAAASSDQDQLPKVTVLLHVPGFAAQHAAAHRSPHFTALAGPVIPASSAPSPAQVRDLIRRASTIYPVQQA